jgi:hypothetical protein
MAYKAAVIKADNAHKSLQRRVNNKQIKDGNSTNSAANI